MKVLFAQELGGGFGHVSRLLEIAALLRGVSVCFVAPAASLAPDMIRARLGSGFTTHAAPQLQVSPQLKERVEEDRTLADALERIGYLDAAALRAQAQAWQALVDAIRPDLIVGDFAPSLRLIATRGAPLLIVGNWFTLPPAGRELPAIKHWKPFVPPASRRRERAFLDNANAVRRERGLKPLAYFADLFHGEKTFPVCFDGFDGYRAYRTGPCLQPFNIADIRPGPAVAARRGPAIFAYLYNGMSGADVVLRTLNALAQPSQVFMRGIDPQWVVSQVGPHVGVHLRPADFAQILPQTRLLLHYGAAGAAYAGLLAGTPQFMIPSNMEHQANAYDAQMLGCGISAKVAHDADPDALKAILARLLEDPVLHNNARQKAFDLALTRRPGGQQAIAQACVELLRGARVQV